MESKHLTDVIERHNRTCNGLIVFLDVEKYSKRRTLTQLEVIDAFTADLRRSLDEVARQHLAYAQNNDLNFKTDVLTIPTGDGAAVVFSFDGLHSVHLDFALQMLRAAYERRELTPCELFRQNGWCNCHPNYNVRVGVADGKAIIFRDVNGNYNVAGTTINLAARVMTLADGNQVIFTGQAYRQIIDMAQDAAFVGSFVEFENVRIKHDERINIAQFRGTDEPFINREPPSTVELSIQMEKTLGQLRGSDPDSARIFPMEDLDPKKMLHAMETLVQAKSAFDSVLQGTIPLGQPSSVGLGLSIEAAKKSTKR